jgi:capsule synthesis protein PGA_cap
MPARHRRRSRLPFAALVLALLVVVGAVVGFRLITRHGDGGQPLHVGVRQRSPIGQPSSSGTHPSPMASPTTPASRGPLVIHGTGDVSIDPGYIPNFRTYGFGYAWSGLNGLFRRDDLTVVNLECAVSNLGTPVPKTFNFRGDPAALSAMRKAGVEVANLGNNHSYDFGPAALLDSRKNLIQADIAPVGAGKDPEQALAPATFDIKGWRIAVVGLDKVVDPYPEAVAAPGHPGTAAGHNLDAMVRAVKAASATADLTVVIVHWGVELDTQPRSDDVELAHRFIDAGGDVIFGGHSHRLQPMGTYKGRPIFYSLGNFVWPNFSVAGATTAVAEVKVSGSGRFTGRLLPAYIASAGHPVLRS